MVLTSTFKTAAFSALALSVAGLSGCMSVNLTPDEITTVTAEATSYNNSHSFAWNITKVMGLEKNFKDAYVDEKVYNEAEASSKLTWYTAGTLITHNPFDLSAMLFLLAPEPTNILENPVYLGYYPKDKATDATAGFHAFEQQILDAYKAAAAEMGFKQTDYTLALDFKREETDGKIQIQMGFGTGKMLISAFETTTPKWIDAAQSPAWAIGASPAPQLGMKTFKAYDGGLFEFDKSRKLKVELLERVAKHLPDHAYMFVPSMRNEQGERTPAYVTDNKQKYFFVMPKAAEPK